MPFPILRHLNLSLKYPIGDDTLFRGNGATLEMLDMRLDSASVSMLRTYRVFVPGSHPKMRKVKVAYIGDVELEPFASLAEAMQFMYRIVSEALVRGYSQYGPPQNYAPMLSLLGNNACTQVMSLPNWSPELWDVVTLIKLLSLLSDLRTLSPILGPIPDGVTLDELPEHIISNYAPMGRRFRCWYITAILVQNYSDLATCVLLPALACPNFTYVATRHICHEELLKAMKEKISEPGFSQYEPCLQPLLVKF
ncbi:hypothetical protein GGH94_005656 [Coemansia aciculifera]|uniref:Uncharacterized protein n=1 Tax=Coemansia aciculifera TaxID=417176 RepID=A0A9W8ID35_9FUNG|nr:hypothetical protein GGH94_005656 [Coemansia aciculifera]